MKTVIKFADEKERKFILQFINNNWKKNHIFVRKPEVFDWQHKSPFENSDKLTFIIARKIDEIDDNSILAILGYIPYKRFDINLENDGLALAIWKVKNGIKSPGIGLQLLKFLEREISPSMILSIGITEVVKPIYKVLNYEMGELKHVALFSPNKIKKTKVASGTDLIPPYQPSSEKEKKLKICRVSNDSIDDKIKEKIDKLGTYSFLNKSFTYVEKRYLLHPFYEYDLFLISVSNSETALFVWRKVKANNSQILRIVDIVGNTNILSQCTNFFIKKLNQASCEYIDLLCHGIDEVIIKKAGFVSADDYSDLILPNYFSPFLQKNITIDFAYKLHKNKNKKVVFFRGDSDQDRPN